ncbi:MAG: excinuclease ABC subunit C [Chlorobi bacterium]|nr:excinuclease ABC subunit C [Chlorobiota bacterium]
MNDLPNSQPASNAPEPEPLELPLSLQDKLNNLPPDPGVYQYFDRDGKVIYVGKAKNLRNRVRSYFQQGRPHDAKTRALVAKIADLQTIVTDSAVEALILEDTLIKKLRPRYNILLKDDKTYPYIRVTNEPFPRVFSTRTRVRDGSRYFGPFTDVKYVRYLLKTLRSIFPIRSCDLTLNDETIAAGKFKVCLDFHIGKCQGPCEGLVSQADYREMIRQVMQVLNGKTRELERTLELDMGHLAEAMRFEEAAAMRNRLQKLREYSGKQKVVSEDLTDRDIIACVAEDDDACAVIFRVRDGRMVGRQHHYLSGVLQMPQPEILRNVIERHYSTAESIPEELLLPIELEDDGELIERFLTDRRAEGKVRLAVPKIGDKQKLVAMAQTNAKFLLDELKLQRMKRSDMVPRPVQSLQRDLGLKKPPRRIECFDNSNIQGTDPVSSMVCFVDGQPRRSEYRKFNVKTVVGPNDFETMREVVGRRYRRVLNEGLALPDLIVIDGGKGQVGAAMEVLQQLNLEHIPLIGLAKRLEEVVVPGQRDTLLLPRSSSSLRLLQQIRDEAHRFAITFHRTLRNRRTLQTELTNVPGIGTKTAQKIFETFGSVRGVIAASLQELQQVLGPKTGQALHEYFQAKAAALSAAAAEEGPATDEQEDDIQLMSDDGQLEGDEEMERDEERNGDAEEEPEEFAGEGELE